jgi:hypothetical protein
MKQGFFYLAISLLFLNCSTSKVKTYVDPNFSNSQVKSIGLLPLRNNFTQTNASLSTGDMLEINKLFQKEFITKNPNAKILNAVETSDLLNAKMLVNDYDNLLQVYGSTGIPNTTVLQNIGRELKIDAIAQGFVTKVVQNDGSYGRVNGETSITVK